MAPLARPAAAAPRGALRLLAPVALLLLQRLPAAAGKLEAGVARLSTSNEEPRWHFMGKFGYAIGAGTYDVRVRLRQPGAMVSVNLEVYLDEDWERVDALPPCRRAYGGPARNTHTLRASEEWSPWMGGTLEQRIRPHIWYFALSKCSGQVSNITYDVDFELRSLQYDTSELSVELRHMPLATVLAVLCLSGFLVRFATQCRRFRRSAGVVHPVIRALGGAVLLQWTAQVLHLLHLVAYERDGVGESAAEVLADMLFMLSQVVSSTLLIVIAQGYTLVSSKDRELESVKPIAAAVALLHVALVGHAHLRGEHSDKHHENEGMVGWALLAVRFLLFAWFCAGVQVLRRNGGLRLQSFLHRFQFAGSLYFLSYPAIFALAQVCAPYLQHPVMHIGLVAMQTASAFWLSDLFLSRGAYYEVSTLSTSLLPGGGRCVPTGFKDE